MNLKTVNFLDVRFNLVINIYQPYRKPNNEPVYIYKQLNHPPNILKELPKSINKQIPAISCDEHVFNNTKETYENALANSGFTEKLKYIQPMNKTKITEKQKMKEKGNLHGSTPLLL